MHTAGELTVGPSRLVPRSMPDHARPRRATPPNSRTRPVGLDVHKDAIAVADAPEAR
jgi:hypothetical protein